MNIIQFQWSNGQGDREFQLCQVDDVPRQGDTIVIGKGEDTIIGVVEAVVWTYKVTRITEVSPEMQTTCQPVVLLSDVNTRPAIDYRGDLDYGRVVSES